MKWSVEDKNKAIELLKQNKTYTEISVILNRTSRGVEGFLKKKGYKYRDFNTHRESRNCKECNKKFDVFKSDTKIFCSHSCAGRFNNLQRPSKIYREFVNCKECNISLRGKHCYSKYCSRDCQIKFEKKVNILKWKNNEINGHHGKLCTLKPFLRSYILEKHNNTCEKCGFDESHPVDGKSILHIHHIDGNAENCLEENLQLLCPNCHSMTSNFGSRNKNSKRNKK